MTLSADAKLYLRTLLNYAEGFDGFQERILEAFDTRKMDPESQEFEDFLTRMGTISQEIWAFIDKKEGE